MMSRRSGNGQTEASQGTSPSVASRHTCITGPVPYRRFVEVSQTVTPLPTAPKSSVAGIPKVQRIRFPVGHNGRRRYPADPASGSLPSPDRAGIVYANRFIVFNDAPSSFGDLPFQGIARQALRDRTLPDVPLKILSALGPFIRLRIRAAMLSSSSHVSGGWLYPYCRSRSVRYARTPTSVW
jgi:hypothetical protein